MIIETGEKPAKSYGSQLNEAERIDYYKDVITFLSKIKGFEIDIRDYSTIKDLRDIIDFLLDIK